MHALTERFRETLRRWRLVEGGERLLVAVSGGVDSMVLLHLLLHLPKPRRPQVEVAHFNHRLRGRASDRDAAFVVRQCVDWEVPGHLGRAEVWRSRSNLEARAREQRYRFLRQTAEIQGIGKVATAHQADDQAETFLIRWLQGSGLRGLSGIPLVSRTGSVGLIRPLLFATRAEIESYATAYKVSYRVDASNRSPNYLRNRVRGIVRLIDEIQPRFSARASVNALFLKADEAYLEQATDSLFEKFSSPDQTSPASLYKKFSQGLSLPISLYRGLPEAMRYRLLQKAYGAVTGKVLSGGQVLRLDRLIVDPSPGPSPYPTPNRSPRKSLNLAGGVRFSKDSRSFGLALAVDSATLPVVPFAV